MKTVNKTSTYPFGSLCTERKESTKNPIEDGLSRYIGLEHLDSDEVRISRWGLIEEDAPSFTKVFRNGDVLLCKRRPYLRKASVVNFDGICSSDIIVLKANEQLILPEIFPHLIHTADFWNYAVKTSSGSLSPRTKFSSLKDFNFEIPSKANQVKLLPILRLSLEIEDKSKEASEQLDILSSAYKSAEMPLEPKESVRVLKEFANESRVDGSNGKLAKKLTVKLYGKGIIANDSKLGSENTKYFIRSAGQFIYSKLDFLNGAFAVIPEHLDGYESTLDLPAFDISQELDPNWLFHYVNRPEYYESFSHSARGGRKAKRIPPKAFLNTKIPLFSKPKQTVQIKVLEEIESEKSLLRDKILYMRKIREKIIFGD